MDADRQMARRPTRRLGRVQISTGQVEGVTRTQHSVDQRGLGRPTLDGSAVVGPGLVAARVADDRRVDPPPFLARDLQHEHVVDVVVGREAL